MLIEMPPVEFFEVEKESCYFQEKTEGLLTEIVTSLSIENNEIVIIPDTFTTIYTEFTPAELEFLFKVVEAETPGCTYENHRNVANVIFNRLRCHFMGTTLTGILIAENQFQVVTTGAYKYYTPSAETIKACEDAWQHDYTGGALYFNRSTTKSHASKYCLFLFQDTCGHNFYKEYD